MSVSSRRLAPAAALLGVAAIALAVLTLASCGGNNDVDGPISPHIGVKSAHQQLPAGLAASVEAETALFLEREGTALRGSLHRFLGPKLTTAVERGSAVCRPARETPAIADPSKYPFACIVRASADGQGLQVGITLGFVGTELEGECWRAANERVSVTTTAPALLSAREARRPVNRIAACA